jgi:hypothetical protein
LPTAGSDYIPCTEMSEPSLRWQVATNAQLPAGTTSPGP